MGQRFERIWRGILYFFALLSGILLFCLAAVVTTDVLMRYATGRPIIGVFEVAEILLVFVTFFAVGFVQHSGRQLRVDALSHRARGRTAAALAVFDGFMALIVFGILLVTGWRELGKAMAGGFLRRGLIEIPTAVPLSVLVFGTALLCVAILVGLVAGLRQLFGRIDHAAANPRE
ncbi:MAG: TRAP transporter small permease [Pseudomonadota bacterium]